MKGKKREGGRRREGRKEKEIMEWSLGGFGASGGDWRPGGPTSLECRGQNSKKSGVRKSVAGEGKIDAEIEDRQLSKYQAVKRKRGVGQQLKRTEASWEGLRVSFKGRES